MVFGDEGLATSITRIGPFSRMSSLNNKTEIRHVYKKICSGLTVWILSVALVRKDLEHNVHWNGRSPLCIFSWEEGYLKLLPHCWHSTIRWSLSSKWILRTCLCKLLALFKTLSQWGHCKPVRLASCNFWWFVNADDTAYKGTGDHPDEVFGDCWQRCLVPLINKNPSKTLVKFWRTVKLVLDIKFKQRLMTKDVQTLQTLLTNDRSKV